MAYDSFKAELEHKADKIDFWHVEDIQEIGDNVLVEFAGTSIPGRSFCADYGYERAGVLAGDDAVEAGATDGHKIVVYEV